MLYWREPTRLLPFEEIEEGALDTRTVFRVRSDRVRSPSTGKVLTIDRLLTPDWVNVVALTEDDEHGAVLLCVRQYRFGTRSLSLELPAGIVDPGEASRAAALRELLEETGHAPHDEASVAELGSVHPNAAFQHNRMTSYYVPRAVRVAELNLDEHEELEVVKLPLHEVDEAVAGGHFTNMAVLAALYRWELLRQNRAVHVGAAS